MLWVAYDEEGLPIGVFDTARELAVFLNVTHRRIYMMLEKEDPRIARISEEDKEDEQLTT